MLPWISSGIKVLILQVNQRAGIFSKKALSGFTRLLIFPSLIYQPNIMQSGKSALYHWDKEGIKSG
jgi:hypothetical protein